MTAWPGRKPHPGTASVDTLCPPGSTEVSANPPKLPLDPYTVSIGTPGSVMAWDATVPLMAAMPTMGRLRGLAPSEP